MKKRFIFTIFIAFLYAFLTKAQTGREIPNLIPPSPKASAIIKYGEYPVSLYTGLVDISIPVHTIDIKGIKVPVEFKYHASGIKYDDISLEVGLGWTLMAGGVVIYTPRGNTDPRYFNTSNYIPFKKEASSINPISNCSDFNSSGGNTDHYYMKKIAEGANSTTAVDGESDIYTYSFLQYSGKFFHHYYGYLNYDNNWTSGSSNRQTVFIPANSLQLVSEYSELQLADKEGINYFFSELERGYYPEEYYTHYLTKIVSADKRDTVYFNYTRFSPVSSYSADRPVFKTPYTIKELSIFNGVWRYERQLEHGGLMDVKSYYPPKLDNIIFRGGRIVFEYTSVRDLRHVKVYNETQTAPIKTVSLEKSNFTNEKQKLDRVIFTDGSNSYDYRFEYEGNPPTNPSGIDYWGYYNGIFTSAGQSFVPYTNVSTRDGFYLLPGIYRSPNESIMKQGILNKVIYPTKGYTVFNYEAHRENNQMYGGLRIKEIYNYNSDGSLFEKKWYQYEWPRAILPIPTASILSNDFISKSKYVEYTQYSGHGPVISKITDVSRYSVFPKKEMFSSGSSVVYGSVTEYVGNQTTDYGKTNYTFTDYREESVGFEHSSENYAAIDMPLRSYTWKNGMLVSKNVYRKETNGQYTRIYSLTNDYKDINTSEYLNLRVYQFVYAQDDILRCPSMYPGSDSWQNSHFDYFNYYLNTGLAVLNYSTIIEDGVEKKIYYDEYNHYGLPVKVRTVLSDGSSQTVQTKYPSDYANNPYTEMVSRNMLSSVIEQSLYKGTASPLSKNITAYKNWGNNLFAPEYLKIQTGTNPVETRITYYNYDRYGNPQYMVKDGAEKVFYIWGYSGQYPIVEIKTQGGYTFQQVENAVKSVFSISSLDALAQQATPNETALRNGTLQNALPNALVTTYTYKPLIGVWTVTDPRGVTVTYEYDALGRLQNVWDGNSRKVETYEYHYKN